MEQSDWRARLLYPIAATYGALAVRRFTHGRPFRSQLPVICVGNFTVGGTGKTPLALLIVRALKGRGERPALLARGYGGRLPGPRRVDPGRDAAAEVGDEALIMAQQATTFVARDRAAGARAIEEGGERANVIVMDDGLQNPSLTKDLTIAVVDGRRGFGTAKCCRRAAKCCRRDRCGRRWSFSYASPMPSSSITRRRVRGRRRARSANG